MICSRCNREIPDGSVSCSYCKNITYHIKNSEYNFTELGFVPTTWSKRLLNYIIDFLVIILIYVAILIILDSFNINIDNETTGLFILLYLLYYFFFESLFSRTIGKILTGTKIITIKGEKPSWKDVLLRTLFRLVPFEHFSYASMRPVGWHDAWSKTFVIPKQNLNSDYQNKSSVLPVISFLIPFISILLYISFISFYTELKETQNQELGIGELLLFFVTMILNLSGMIMGIISVAKKYNRKILSYLGIGLNLFILAGILLIFIL